MYVYICIVIAVIIVVIIVLQHMHLYTEISKVNAYSVAMLIIELKVTAKRFQEKNVKYRSSSKFILKCRAFTCLYFQYYKS